MAGQSANRSQFNYLINKAFRKRLFRKYFKLPEDYKDFMANHMAAVQRNEGLLNELLEFNQILCADNVELVASNKGLREEVKKLTRKIKDFQ